MHLIINKGKKWSKDFLYAFGKHCATHQIRLILVSGFVITSLFYPALAIYFSNNRHLSVNFRSHIWDYVYSPEAYNENDLVRVWTSHTALHINEGSVARARCGTERTIRIERILMAQNDFGENGVLNGQTLTSAAEIEKAISEGLSARNAPCFIPGCKPISPLSFWDNDEQSVLQDPDLLRTINSRTDVNVGGFAVSREMVLAGRESADHDKNAVVFAHFLSSSFLFYQDDCGVGGHNVWLKVLEEYVSPLVDLQIKRQEPILLALELNPELKPGRHFSAVTVLLYASYCIFFVYFSGSMRRLNTVHSRMGLCFTGLVEIICSTITSLSVCAVIGLRITMVPWTIFPIVIVFVGAENMFRLIDEVVKTSVTLPVKDRIGLGLVRAGSSNTLKVVSYNAIIGVIGFFAQGAIRQFCIFVTVVLVAHWFLIHTFFVAVLSIDLQRLELNDLIRQGLNAPSAPVPNGLANKGVSTKATARIPPPSLLKTVSVARPRLTRNFSLLMLLAFTGALYYTTLPASSKKNILVSRPWRENARPKAEFIADDAHSQARQLWRVLNPEDDPLVHLMVEAPAVLTLSAPYDQHDTAHSPMKTRSRWSNSRTLRPLIWTFKIMVFPMTATLGCLYVFLLYLLKGTDRLENNISERCKDQEKLPLNRDVSFRTLPRAFPSDVSLLRASADASVIVSASVDHEVHVWRGHGGSCMSVDTDMLLVPGHRRNGLSLSVTSIAVDNDGKLFAIGTTTGIVGVWKLEEEEVMFQLILRLDNIASPVKSLDFVPGESSNGTDMIIACYDDANVVRWSIEGSSPTSVHPRGARCPTNADIIKVPSSDKPWIGFSMPEGHIELVGAVDTGGADKTMSMFANDNSTILHVQSVDVHGSKHMICAVASSIGLTSLYDLTDHEHIIDIEEAFEVVSKLRIIPLPSKACTQCGEVPTCTFLVAYQVGHIIYMDQGRLIQRCTCPTAQPLVSRNLAYRELANGRRSRSSSFVGSSGGEGFLRPKHRVPSFSNGFPSSSAPFPGPNHGIHSRRPSDKDSRRHSERFDKQVVVSLDGVPQDPSSNLLPNGTHDSSPAATDPTSERWRNFKLMRVREATCERAGWEVIGNRIVGVRRMPRSRSNETTKDISIPVASVGIPSSMLDRWELWAIDPTKGERSIQASLLSNIHTSDSSSTIGRQPSQLSFTRLSAMHVCGSRYLFGLGNTIGLVDFPTDILKSK